MSERRISLEERAEVRRYTDSYSSELKPDNVFTVEDALNDFDAADEEIAALKAQMAGMVTLEQVEKALSIALGGKTEYTSLLMVAVRNNLAAAERASQSTPHRTKGVS